jgi:hypothetical protein
MFVTKLTQKTDSMILHSFTSWLQGPIEQADVAVML